MSYSTLATCKRRAAKARLYRYRELQRKTQADPCEVRRLPVTQTARRGALEQDSTSRAELAGSRSAPRSTQQSGTAIGT